jgi:hypothetical protein
MARPSNYQYVAVRAKVYQLLEAIHGGGEWMVWEYTCVCASKCLSLTSEVWPS